MVAGRHHFFPFRPPTPPVNLPKLPRLDFGLCTGALGGGGRCTVLPALEGLSDGFGPSGRAFSLFASLAILVAGVPSST